MPAESPNTGRRAPTILPRLRPTTGLVALSLLVVLTFAGFFTYSSVQARMAAIEGAERHTLNLVRTLQQHISRTFGAVDTMLQGAGEGMILRELAGGPMVAGDLQAAVQGRVLDTPQVRALLILDETGWLRYDSDTPAPDPLDLSDREYFRVHLGGRGDALHIGDPVLGRASGRAFIPVSRAILDPSNRLRGVGVAVVEPEYFRDFFSTLDVGAGGDVMLLNADGTLLVAATADDDQELAAELAAEIERGTMAFDEVPRLQYGKGHIIARAAVAGYPLVIVVALTEDDVLATWRQGNLFYLVSATLVLAVMGLLTWRLVDQLHRTEAAQDALRTAERDYRSIFDNAVDGMYRCDADGRLLRANGALAALNGYRSPDELIAGARNLGGEWYVDPNRRRDFRELLAGQGWVSDFVAQVRRHRTGECIWVSENARAIRDPGGEVLFYEGAIRDITAAREAEDRLRDAKERAELADRAKSEFLANMSHELRTPLNAIIGFAEIIRDELFGSTGNPLYREYATDIHDSGRHLLALINEILDLAKVEAGSLKLREEAVSLGDVMDACRRLVRDRAQDQGVDVHAEAAATLPRVFADPTRIKQVVLNLLSNAVKFTPAGGRIVLAARVEAGGGVVLTVADTGIGMAPESVEVALQPFRQIENAFNRRHQGTGLGLPLAKRMIELHGGTLVIASTLGEGTTVEVRLPASRVLGHPAELAPSTRSGDGAPVGTSSPGTPSPGRNEPAVPASNA
ncbi:ATP-binding protein [Arenibaculum sp.]|uniref:ATP-binding protein n=1 Tax=Arenibaculum sp. TaxID=2865862 RepID=UPI002E11561B|nr:ATP-binding protein [Arenibaculum sp.]